MRSSCVARNAVPLRGHVEHACSRMAGVALLFVLSCWPLAASAASLDGASLSVWWGVPFAGVLLSIAVFPLVAPKLWHHHFGKISVAWAAVFLVPFAFAFGASTAFGTLIHALLEEYVPFIVLLT